METEAMVLRRRARVILLGAMLALPEQPTADQLVDQLAKTGEESRIAAKRLLELGDAALPAMLARLDSENDWLRWQLVNLLGTLRAKEALAPLVQVAVKYSEPHARWRAYWAIGAVDGGRAAALFRTHLASPDAQVRWNAAIGMSFLGFSDAVEIVEEGLTAAEEWKRWEAVNSLSQAHHPDSWEKVCRLAREDPADSIRQEAVMTLWKMGDSQALPTLIHSSHDESPQVRWRALCAIARLDRSRREWVVSAGQADPSAIVREALPRCVPQ